MVVAIQKMLLTIRTVLEAVLETVLTRRMMPEVVPETMLSEGQGKRWQWIWRFHNRPLCPGCFWDWWPS